MLISSSGYIGSCIHGLAVQKNSVLNCCHHENLVCHASVAFPSFSYASCRKWWEYVDYDLASVFGYRNFWFMKEWCSNKLDKIRLSLEVAVWHAFNLWFQTPTGWLCSIPDGVIGIFHWHNPSGCTMALGLTQPLTEMSTRNISWGVKVASA
jgi:hypothetical protein